MDGYLAESILEQIEEGVVILDGNRRITYMNSSSKEMFGIDLSRGYDHGPGVLSDGDLVVIACNCIDVDEEILESADLVKIGVDTKDIRIGDAVIAWGLLGGQVGTGGCKVKHSGREDRILEFSQVLDDGLVLSAGINEVSRLLHVEAGDRRFELDFQNFNCLTLVLEKDTHDLKFYQSPGYSRRYETAGNILGGKRFEGKGTYATSRDALGEKLDILNPGKACSDAVDEVLGGGSAGIKGLESSINTLSVCLSVFTNMDHEGAEGGCTLIINNTSRVKALQRELDAAVVKRNPFDKVLGDSLAISKSKKLAEKVSGSKSTILLQGESGTGKGVFARAIHERSPRCGKPFVSINMAAIPGNLLESELFGYVEGAFTGSVKGGRKGKFAVAQGGTLFLDEIGDMDLNLQAKVLQAIQENRIYPVGATDPLDIDVRIIAATNKDLYHEVKSGRFREDLYYRLNVINIVIPPLRDRMEDLKDMVFSKLPQLNKRIGKSVTGVEDEVFNLLHSYDWPGNVRELENVMESAVNVCEGERISLGDLPERFVEGIGKSMEDDASKMLSIKKAGQEAERKAIETVLKLTGGNRTKAAKILGIGRTAFYNKLKRYNIK